MFADLGHYLPICLSMKDGVEGFFKWRNEEHKQKIWLVVKGPLFPLFFLFPFYSCDRSLVHVFMRSFSGAFLPRGCVQWIGGVGGELESDWSENASCQTSPCCIRRCIFQAELVPRSPGLLSLGLHSVESQQMVATRSHQQIPLFKIKYSENMLACTTVLLPSLHRSLLSFRMNASYPGIKKLLS